MYADMDNPSEVEEEFFNALALLHSTDDDSAEKLRKMLDASIEKKYGPSKTLAVRIPNDGLPGSKSKQEQTARSSNLKHQKGQRQKAGERVRRAGAKGELPATSSAGQVRLTTIPASNFASFVEKGDIPRISIPDEGSSAADGALCKICNGAKLGPLILLECQECQDVYHPLCHQPPVVDIDVYDPRLVWRCGKCVEASNVALVAPAAVKPDGKKPQVRAGKSSGNTRTKATMTDRDKTKEKESKELNYFRRTKFKFSDRENSGKGKIPSSTSSTLGIMRESLRRSLPANPTATSQKTVAVPSSSGVQLRKRVGSKLTVTRASTK